MQARHSRRIRAGVVVPGLLLSLALTGLFEAAPACGQTFSAMSGGSGVTVLINSSFNGLTGYSFTPTEDITVSELGCVDTSPDGLIAQHEVGLFRRDTGAPLALVTIPAGTAAPKTGDSRYLPIDTIVLHAGTEYYVHANNFHIDMFRFTFADQSAFVSVNANITWLSSVITADTNSIYSAYAPDAGLGPGFGPNFRFTLGAVDCNRNGIPDDRDTPDCDGNGVPDECDLADGTAEDCNTNGVPDSCDLAGSPFLDGNHNGIIDICEICGGDYDLNGQVNTTDLLGLLATWGVCTRCFPGQISESCPADGNLDCAINVTDLLILIGNWGPCPP